MLLVYVGEDGREVNPETWFDNRFDEDLLFTDFSKRLLKATGCTVMPCGVIKSEILGYIPPMMIDRGCKAVLYMMYEEDIESFGRIPIKWCGDNLIPFIREACDKRDVPISCTRMFPYFSKDYGEFTGCVKMMDTGKICNTAMEFFDEYLDIEGFRNER